MLLTLILIGYKTSKGYSKGFTLNNIQFALLRVEDDKIIHGKGKNAQNFTRISPHSLTSPTFHPDRFHPQSLSINPKSFLGKSPHTLPVTIQKTGQAVVIGLGEKDAVAGQVSKAVGKIADYIESVGY